MTADNLARRPFCPSTPIARTVVRVAGMARTGLGTAVGHLMAWQERRRQRQTLLRLDDHLLKDIGLSRADADFEGAKPFWRG